MDAYLLQFFTIAGVTFIAVLSPGPDMLLVFQHSLSYGRPKVYFTCLGIGSSILLHSVYALSGVSLLLHVYPLLNTIFALVGAAFLLYLAHKAWGASGFQLQAAGAQRAPGQSAWQLWKLGFLTNALNVKAYLFFLGLFSVAVAPATPLWMQIGYVAYLTLSTTIIFICLSWLLTKPQIAARLERYSVGIYKAVAAMFAALALMLLLDLL